MLAPSLSKWNRAAITWTASILRILAQCASGANRGRPADSSKRKRFLSFSKRFLCCFYSAPRTARRLLLLLLATTASYFRLSIAPCQNNAATALYFAFDWILSTCPGVSALAPRQPAV